METQLTVHKMQGGLERVDSYIRDLWEQMNQGTHRYFEGFNDPLTQAVQEAQSNLAGTKSEPIIYLPPNEDKEGLRQKLEDRRMAMSVEQGKPLSEIPNVKLVNLLLDEKGHILPPKESGNLYLPEKFISPSPGKTRFSNTMYNWDSAFVVRGLLQTGMFQEAKGIVDNMLYQIENYGTVLNGTGPWSLDEEKHRSQPPLVSAKVMAIYHNYDKIPGTTEDKDTWLKKAAELCEKYHDHWMTAPHLDGKTGLSRYDSTHGKPLTEVVSSEPNHYPHALLELAKRHVELMERRPGFLHKYRDKKDAYYLQQYMQTEEDAAPAIPKEQMKTISPGALFRGNGRSASTQGYEFVGTYTDEQGAPHVYIEKKDGKSEHLTLSKDFYRGDWAMRESGMDPTRLFGFFAVDVINYLPTCLNSLRGKMEREISQIYSLLDKAEPGNPEYAEKQAQWKEQHRQTSEAINKELWDDGIEAGSKPCYRNLNTSPLGEAYDLPKFRDYPSITSFYPLWAGVASQEQADQTIDHLYPKLKTDFGLMTSRRMSGKLSGSQWDDPMIWAPHQMIGVEALEKYGHYHKAMDVALSYLEMIVDDFNRTSKLDGNDTGKLFEKYEGRTGTSNTSKYVDKGYDTNVEGFAWTNSAVLELCFAVDRLQHKINCEPIERPDITTLFNVKSEGLVQQSAVDNIEDMKPRYQALLENGVRLRDLIPQSLRKQLPKEQGGAELGNVSAGYSR